MTEALEFGMRNAEILEIENKRQKALSQGQRHWNAEWGMRNAEILMGEDRRLRP